VGDVEIFLSAAHLLRTQGDPAPATVPVLDLVRRVTRRTTIGGWSSGHRPPPTPPKRTIPLPSGEPAAGWELKPPGCGPATAVAAVGPLPGNGFQPSEELDCALFRFGTGNRKEPVVPLLSSQKAAGGKCCGLPETARA
jgi:hypothetical protein